MGRFINADAYASTGQGILGNNMFAYCLNNPIRNIDGEGTMSNPRYQQKQTDILPPGSGAGAGLGLGAVIGSVALLPFLLWNLLLQGVKAINEWGQDLQQLSIKSEKQFEFGKCLEFAQRKKKQNEDKGNIVHLYFPNAYNGFVVSDRYPFAISVNGHHYGYMYEGIVYCNVYPEGRPYLKWINSFHDASNQEPIIQIF